MHTLLHGIVSLPCTSMDRLAIQPVSLCYTPPSTLDDAYMLHCSYLYAKNRMGTVTYVSDKN